MIKINSLTFLLCLLTLSWANGVLASSLKENIINCLDLKDSAQRLACYDSIASALHPAPKVVYIQPSKRFLNSRLVTTPWETDLSLTIAGFVELLSQAVMSNNKKITINGWTKQDQLYVLNINMGEPVELKFQPRGMGADTPSMSLLQKPFYKGDNINAELFVFTIASMIPEKKEKH